MIKLLLVGSVLAPMLIFAMVALETYREVYRTAEANAQHAAALIEEHALKTFETIALALKLTDQRIAGMSSAQIRNSKPLWDEITGVQETLEQADSIFIVDETGDNIFTTRVFPAAVSDFTDRDYFADQKERDRGLYVGKSYVGRISNRPIFNLSIRRSSPDGTFKGVVGSSAYVNYFEHFFETVGLPGQGASVALVRDDGEVLVAYPPAQVSERMDPALLAHPSSFHEERGGLVLSKQMRGFPVHVWYSVDKATLLHRWYDRLAYWGFLTFTVAALLFAVSWLALRRAKAEAAALDELERQVKQRQDAEDQLRHAQKMEALGQLTGGVAHDFNNLLQVIISGVYTLRRTVDAKSLPAVELIRHAAQRSAHLTRQLLSFSRRQQLNPEPTDLRQKILQVAPIIERSLRGDIQLKLAIGDDLWPVEIDQVEFEMALINIGANARDAMPDGGVFEISVANATLTGSETPERLTGNFVEVAVRDTGTGMPKDIASRVFEPFFTTKEVDRGTGLGLSQVYGFARQSGGSVALDSREGEGTRITLYLPRSDKQPATAKRAPDRWLPSQTGVRILMVEDNPEVARTGAEMLRGMGYTVDVVDHAHAALDILTAHVQRFDLVLSDIVMPGGMSGLEFRDEVSKRYPHLPVVLVTGYSRDVPAASGNVVILQKPYEPLALKRTIDEALAKAS